MATKLRITKWDGSKHIILNDKAGKNLEFHKRYNSLEENVKADQLYKIEEVETEIKEVKGLKKESVTNVIEVHHEGSNKAKAIQLEAENAALKKELEASKATSAKTK